MTEEQKQSIRQMRNTGLSYKQIATTVDISENTIKSFCRRNDLNENVCQQCVTVISRKKKFCSDTCRMAWWNAHPEKVNRKAVYVIDCKFCGKKFESYGNKDRKYCSRECYGKSKSRGG